MREIEFRAWDKAAKRMLYGDDLPANLVPANVNEYFLDDNYIWLQYTGLQDKNGKDIYEGDIVKIKAGLYFVDFSHAGTIFMGLTYRNSYGWQKAKEDGIIIIGNKYENSDLI